MTGAPIVPCVFCRSLAFRFEEGDFAWDSPSSHNTAPATRRRVDIREVVAELHRRHPRAGEDRLAEMLVGRLEEDRHLLARCWPLSRAKVLAAAETRARQSRAAPTPRQRAKRQATEKAAVTAVAARVKELVLLDLMMPNGVAMRFCSGTQMAGFGTAYEKIAERAGTAMVGEVLVEAEVKALLCAPPT